MPEIHKHLQRWLRQRPAWLRFQEARREGFRRAWKRSRYQRRILDTPPVFTGTSGPIEVRALTWRRDWMNLVWALKSFYHFSRADYPLFIHDGGLLPEQAEKLQRHFPTATIVGAAEADRQTEAELSRRGLNRCVEYRRLNPSTRKLFDFFALSQAEYLVCIDSDIVFFQYPELLIVPPEGLARNRYNRDLSDDWYSMTPDELEAAFGIRPPPRINSGLAVIRHSSIDFAAIDRWLEHPKLFANRWVTEQTLHALASTVHGVELLPDTYLVDNQPGLPPNIICKHYPSFFRPLLYSEGMDHLIRTGFLDALRCSRATASPPRSR
jgi:hypothetical protein